MWSPSRSGDKQWALGSAEVAGVCRTAQRAGSCAPGAGPKLGGSSSHPRLRAGWCPCSETLGGSQGVAAVGMRAEQGHRRLHRTEGCWSSWPHHRAPRHVLIKFGDFKIKVNSLKKLNIELPYDPAILLLGIYIQEDQKQGLRQIFVPPCS